MKKLITQSSLTFLTQMDEPLDYALWSSVLERTYLRFQWSEEAKKHTYIDRYYVTPHDVEEVIEMYFNTVIVKKFRRKNNIAKIIIQ